MHRCNHGCNPNCKVEEYSPSGWNNDLALLMLVSTREIAPGEEVTLCYKGTMWQSLASLSFETPSGRRKIQCGCSDPCPNGLGRLDWIEPRRHPTAATRAKWNRGRLLEINGSGSDSEPVSVNTGKQPTLPKDTAATRAICRPMQRRQEGDSGLPDASAVARQKNNNSDEARKSAASKIRTETLQAPRPRLKQETLSSWKLCPLANSPPGIDCTTARRVGPSSRAVAETTAKGSDTRLRTKQASTTRRPTPQAPVALSKPAPAPELDQIVTLTSGPTALKSGKEENTCPPPIGRITSENQEALLEQLAETEQELSALLKSMKQVRTGTAEHSSLSPVLQENLMTTLYEVTDETRLLNLLEHIDSEDRCLDSMQRELHSTLAEARKPRATSADL